jgi:hypothetical protein
VVALLVEVDELDVDLTAAGLALPPHALANNTRIDVAAAAATRRPPNGPFIPLNGNSPGPAGGRHRPLGPCVRPLSCFFLR